MGCFSRGDSPLLLFRIIRQFLVIQLFSDEAGSAVNCSNKINTLMFPKQRRIIQVFAYPKSWSPTL